MELLDRARKINAMLQKTTGKSVNFNDMSATLRDAIKGNILLSVGAGSCSDLRLTRKLKMSV